MHRTALGVVIDFAELSDPGRDPSKQVNEDASAYAETPFGHLTVLCDGMGGHLAGREASSLAVREIIARVIAAPEGSAPSEVLAQAIVGAGREVYALGADAPLASRPGATCVAALIHPGGVYLAHVGDSRCYLIRKGHPTQLTRDHSVVAELVAAGVLTAEAAQDHPDANQITRALGIAPEPEVELGGPFALFAADVLLLASDGLTDLISDAELATGTARGLASGPAVVCQQLVDLANQRGGHDNITVQVVEVIDAPARSGPKTALLEAVVPHAPAVSPPIAKTVVGHTVELPPQDAAPPVQAAGATQLFPTLTPTMTDEVPRTERAPPTLIDTPFTPGSAPAAALSGPPARRAELGRYLVPIAALIAGVIVVAVALWWLVGWRTRRPEPQPEPVLLNAPAQDAGVLELKPTPEPPVTEPTTPPTHDAGPSAPAQTPPSGGQDP